MSKSRNQIPQDQIAQFCGITGGSTDVARRYLEKYKRLDNAIDAFYNDPQPAQPAQRNAGPSTTKITQLFEKYKAADENPVDPALDAVTFEGTTVFCDEIGIQPDDIVLLALAHDLKSPRMGQWPRKEWIEGWRSYGVDTTAGLKGLLPALRDKLKRDPAYFTKVYQHTFNFAREEGQRSLPMDTAKAFWEMMIPVGLKGGALSHIGSLDDEDGDTNMDVSHEAGWNDDLTALWFQFLDEKGGKGVSKDTWSMFREFVRVIDVNFEKYDVEAAWPSAIDDFVEWVKEHQTK